MTVSRIALGCMRMADLTRQEAVSTSLHQGMNFFDHADIYGGGESEIRFAQAMTDLGIKREDIFLQSKCGIRKGYFDFSNQWTIF